STGFNLVARLERELASEYDRMGYDAGTARSDSAPVHWLRRLTGSAKHPGPPRLRRIEELENAAAIYPLGLDARDSIATLEAALERFAGNHTVHLSTTAGGVVRSYPLPENPRQLGSTVQRVLWTRGAD